jgi:hypothetical protein
VGQGAERYMDLQKHVLDTPEPTTERISRPILHKNPQHNYLYIDESQERKYYFSVFLQKL